MSEQQVAAAKTGILRYRQSLKTFTLSDARSLEK